MQILLHEHRYNSVEFFYSFLCATKCLNKRPAC